VIRSCRDKRTSDFLAGKRVKEFEACAKGAARALTRLQAATVLYDLRNPPSNRFEGLGGDRRGEFSIRIDRQWRVCFRWRLLAEGDTWPEFYPSRNTALVGTAPGEAYDVEVNKHYE
jgi:toxin HigB-1